MQEFTGLEYLKIEIAGLYGMKNYVWKDRIDWTESFKIHELRDHQTDAKEPIAFMKAVNAYEKALNNEPIGHPSTMDATASGMQIMAVTTGCHDTALYTNMIDPNEVYSPYRRTYQRMMLQFPLGIPLYKIVKKGVMTYYFNKQGPDYFSEEQAVALHRILDVDFPGASTYKSLCNNQWNYTADYHSWILPDKHVAYVPVIITAEKKIEVDELDASFQYRYAKVQSDDWYGSLCPNITHSIDGYITRELIRRARRLGFRVVTIHDDFRAHPNNMNEVRQLYIRIMYEIAQMNLLENILRQLGLDRSLTKFSHDLPKYILESEYMLN